MLLPKLAGLLLCLVQLRTTYVSAPCVLAVNSLNCAVGADKLSPLLKVDKNSQVSLFLVSFPFFLMMVLVPRPTVSQ